MTTSLKFSAYAGIALAITVPASLIHAAHARSLYFEAFEGEAVLDRWGGGADYRPPIQRLSESPAPGVFGQIIELRGPSVQTTLPENVPIGDADRIAFWTKVEAPHDGPVKLDLSFCDIRHTKRLFDLDEDFKVKRELLNRSRDPSCWNRRVKVQGTGWRHESLPLRSFMPTTPRRPAWEEMRTLTIGVLGEAQRALIDSIDIIAGSIPQAAYRSTAHIEKIAFRRRKDSPGPYQIRYRDPFVVLSNAERMDLAGLLDALDALSQRVRADFPNMQTPQRALPVVVFANEAEFNEFTNRLARLAGRDGVEGGARLAGATMGSVASSYHSAERGFPDIPVYVHEAAHSLLGTAWGFQGTKDWLQEGAATLYASELARPRVRTQLDRGLRLPEARSRFRELLRALIYLTQQATRGTQET